MANNGHGSLATKSPFRQFDLTNPDNYEGDYPEGGGRNNVKDLYEVPGIEDMANVFIRGNFKNERQLNAALRLYYRHKKFSDTTHQEMLRCKVAGSSAIGGASRVEALFGATCLVASDMYRVVKGLPKAKHGEQDRVIKGSDFRDDQRPPDSLANQPR